MCAQRQSFPLLVFYAPAKFEEKDKTRVASLTEPSLSLSKMEGDRRGVEVVVDSITSGSTVASKGV